MKNQTAAVAVAANVGSVDNVAVDNVAVDNVAVDIYVAVTGVANAAVGIPAAAAADVANAAGALSNNSASCFLCRVLHCAVLLSVIKHTAELGCGKGLAAGI